MPSLPLCRHVDSAVLKPELPRAAARAEIETGVKLRVRTVCVRPADIPMALELCRGSSTEVGTVLSFPHGCGLPAAKTAEARAYLALGVPEIDMVANYGLIRSGEWALVEADLRAVAELVVPAGALLKVILETSELSRDQILRATEIAVAVGAQFVKTSTGFASGGATREAVAAMLEAGRGRIQVKASGAIRDAATAHAFLAMGCTRLGVGSTAVPALLAGSPDAGQEPY